MTVRFSEIKPPQDGTLVVFAGDDLTLGAHAAELVGGETLSRAAKAAEFTGAENQSMTLLAPADSGLERLIVVGIGKGLPAREHALSDLGGRIAAAIGRKTDAAILFDAGPAPVAADTGEDASEVAEAPDSAERIALILAGLELRGYNYERFKTKTDDDKPAKGRKKRAARVITVLTDQASAAKKAFARRQAVVDGVNLARDLVNDPPNVLGPVEFAERCKALEDLGVTVDILGDRDMKKLGMGALLAVGQGSERESRLVVMRWKGTKKKGAKPVAFVGKGVIFDSGGISIKPAGGMEDMKGDMAGAACVAGLMHALAARKAKVDAIGVVGLVENMPDGRAQRPGDIVTAMSGKTIEVINTDAEGRLVLADALHYVIKTYEPQAVIDLATLTGAIIVALGHHHAGLFSNSDNLATELTTAGETTGDLVWRMPLGKPYDKLIDSKFADMKNTGGRWAGSITAAQFLQRFVGDTPWAHLDIAGTGMGSPKSDINESWGSGFGVRLLDRYVADVHEGGRR